MLFMSEKTYNKGVLVEGKADQIKIINKILAKVLFCVVVTAIKFLKRSCSYYDAFDQF